MTPTTAKPPLRQLGAILGTVLCTSLGNMAQITVLGKLIYDLTGSELELGFLGLAEFTPAAVLVLVAGAVADRYDRRRVVAIGAGANAAVALVLAWYVRHPRGISTVPIFALVLAFGVGQAFLSPALRSIPADMVSADRLPWLMARRSTAWQSATIIGPVLAGFLYGIGVWVPMVAVGLLSSMGAVAILVVKLPDGARRHAPRRRSRPEPTGGADAEAGRLSPPAPGGLHEALEGLRFVRGQPILLGAISLDLFAVFFGGAVTLLPAIADRLHVGALGLGWLRAAGGIGAASTTILLSLRPLRRRVGWTLLAVVTIFGGWTIVLGVTRSYALAFVAILALSAADAVSVFIRSTLVPLVTPPHMRGRVLAVENVFIGGSNELGGFESGVAGQLLGTTGSIVAGGIGTLAVAASWAWLFAPLRRVDRFPTAPLAEGERSPPPGSA